MTYERLNTGIGFDGNFRRHHCYSLPWHQEEIENGNARKMSGCVGFFLGSSKQE